MNDTRSGRQQLPPLVYDLACAYLALVFVIGAAANGSVTFIFIKSKKVKGNLQFFFHSPTRSLITSHDKNIYDVYLQLYLLTAKEFFYDF